jgi:hypothetical protein
MTHLVVLGPDNREDAERAFDLAGDLAKQQLLQGKAAVFLLARSATVDRRSRRSSRTAPRSSRPT